MLDAHPGVDCGHETRFFTQLPRDPATLLAAPSWPDRAADYVCSLRSPRGEKPIHELYGRSRDDVRSFLMQRPPSVAAMLESLTRARADANGKRRWAEKTPRHLSHLPAIRAAFPDAAIVRVVRDPRASSLSMTRVPFASDSLIANLYVCERTDGAVAVALNRDAWLLTIRFEALLSDPEEQLRRVCDFIGEPFEPEMLAPRSAGSLLEGHEWWKAKASERPDPSRIDAWQAEMAPVDQQAAAVICHGMLRRHGYPGWQAPRRAVIVEPDGIVNRQEDAVRRLAVAGVILRRRRGRAGPRNSGETAALTTDLCFWAADGRDPWHLGRSRRARLRSLTRMSAILVRYRLSRRRAAWIRDPQSADAAPEGRQSRATRTAELLLQALANPTSAEGWLGSLGAAQATTSRQPVPAEDVR